MAIPTTRATFKDYCLRNLGFGVIDINVSDAQVDDRIDEALQYFAQYHYDGIEKMYLQYKLHRTILIELQPMMKLLQQIQKMEQSLQHF